MSKKAFNIIALLGCLGYLIGNILYDTVSKNPYIYYIPLGIMIFTLVLLSWQNTKEGILKEFWLGFLILSVSQVIKFTIFNPFVQTINDYAWLLVVVVFIVRRIHRLRK